ncbi:MAG: aldo/keto reductase [Burkholderiaceae bacterium]|nr:aldo/keto reductase [Burkholderiaceae bacterium]
MVTRREWLGHALGAAAALGLAPRLAGAQSSGESSLILRAIPSTGERLPIIGLGSSATFAQVARKDDHEALRAVLAKMVELGGTVFDTAPSYGASEEVAGRIAQSLGIADKLFWATKVNVASRGGAADAAAARQQIEVSFSRIGRKRIDLIQVHNMGDIATQLPVLREFKQQGRVRYLGVTTTFESQYAGLIDTMRTQKLDFIGTNYAIDDRFAEQTILPLARDKGIAVLCYAPFGRSRLWARVKDRPLPAWAAEFDAVTWAQFFLKFVASHPDITCITPATSRASNMADNMAGGRGRLPDAAMRKRMIALIDGLPGA